MLTPLNVFVVWLKFNNAQKWIGLKKYKYFFFTSLSPVNVFPRLKIPRISSYGHCSNHVISKFRNVNKMAEYKSVSIHINYWPTRHSKMIHPKAFRSSIIVSLFWCHSGTRIQFNLWSMHVRRVTRDVMWWLHNVMWRFR